MRSGQLPPGRARSNRPPRRRPAHPSLTPRGGPRLPATTCFSVPIFLFTAALFVVFPRVGLSLLLLNHRNGDRTIGFSDKVDLGGSARSAISCARAPLRGPGPVDPPSRSSRSASAAPRSTSTPAVAGISRPGRTAPTPHQHRRRRCPDPAPGDDRKDPHRASRPSIHGGLPPTTHGRAPARTQQQALGGDAPDLARPEGEVRYGRRGAHGLRYDVYVARRARADHGEPPAAERPRLELPIDTPDRIAQRSPTVDRRAAHGVREGEGDRGPPQDRLRTSSARRRAASLSRSIASSSIRSAGTASSSPTAMAIMLRARSVSRRAT